MSSAILCLDEELLIKVEIFNRYKLRSSPMLQQESSKWKKWRIQRKTRIITSQSLGISLLQLDKEKHYALTIEDIFVLWKWMYQKWIIMISVSSSAITLLWTYASRKKWCQYFIHVSVTYWHYKLRFDDDTRWLQTITLAETFLPIMCWVHGTIITEWEAIASVNTIVKQLWCELTLSN